MNLHTGEMQEQIQEAVETTEPIQPAPTASGQITPYLYARQQWDERYGTLLTRARNWRVACFFCLAIICLMTLSMIPLARKAHPVPYIIEVDKSGHYVNRGPAEQAGPLDVHRIQADLTDWLQRVRTVTSDPQVERANIDHIYAMLQQNSPAFTFLNDYYRNNNPFEKAQTVTTSVQIHSFIPVSNRTYELSWTETQRDPHGEVISTQEYRGSISITINPPTDEETININPSGIYVNQIGWSKVL